MRRSLALALLISLVGGPDLVAQALDDALVPRGRLRLQAYPSYVRWDSRFGRTAAGETGREDLGEDLTTPSAESLFPGSADLSGAIASMTAAPAYAPLLGAAVGRVTKDVTRIDFGGHIGVFDWLTVGAVLPWLRTRTNVDLAFTPDTLAGDLGANPSTTDPALVNAFLAGLTNAEAAAQSNAASVCGSSPGSAACTSAQALAAQAASFLGSAQTAYDATPFFPMSGSTTATSLTQATAQLDSDLVAAGLPPIGAPMAFASQWVDPADFPLLTGDANSGIGGAALGDIRSIWSAGDVEVSATFRILEGARRDSVGASPSLSYSLLGTVLGRLPTGQVDDPDFFLDVGWGDGQTDIEGRLLAQLGIGGRLAVWGSARYGVQMSRTLVRRVAPPEVAAPALSSRHLVEWSPGSFFGLELAPALRLSPELTLAGEYRVYRKWRDTYALAGASVGAPVDPAVLELESGVTLHEVGGSLRYDTLAPWMAGGEAGPVQLHLRAIGAVAGGGGQTPVATRIEFGVRLFRRFWGRP